MEVGSSAYVALEEVVLNKKFLKDIEKLTEFHHTGELEVYHSLLLKYVPKRLHFSHKGMVVRTQLAVIDHNSNTERNQGHSDKGKEQRGEKVQVGFSKREEKMGCKTSKDWKVIFICTRLDGSCFFYGER